jgi:MFS family permease
VPTRASLGLPDVRGRTPLLAGLAIDSFGGGCAGPLLLLYFNRVADIPLGRAGVLLTLASLVSLVVPAIVGHVIDRTGPRNLVVLAQIAQGLAFTAFLLGRSAPLMFCAAVVMVAGQRVFWSSIFSLLSDIADERDRDRWFGLGGMMQAAGFGLGSLAAGALLAIGGDGPLIAAMAVNAASFAVAAVLLGRLTVHHDPALASDEEKARLRDDPRFVALIAVNGILALCTMMIGIGLPVYVVDALPAPDWLVGLLLAGVSVTLATGQTLVVRFSAGRRRTRVLVLSGTLWAAWGLLMAGLLHLPTGLVVPLLVLATVVFAAADVLHAATSNALAAAIAPERGRGKYLSNWQYSFTLAQIAVPAFFAGLFEVRADLPWLVVAGLAAVAAIAVLALERGLREPART